MILLYFLLTSIFTLISRLPQAARCTPVHRPAQSPSSIFRLHCRPSFPAPTAPMLPLSVGLLLPPPEAVPLSPLALTQRWRGREGDPVRPEGGRSAAAGADITRPKRPGRSAPTPTRHAAGGVLSNLRDSFHAPAKRGVRGCRGCRGGTPLTPCPAPGRRPVARSGQQTQDKREQKGCSGKVKKVTAPLLRETAFSCALERHGSPHGRGEACKTLKSRKHQCHIF